MNNGQQKIYQYILDNLAEGQLGVNERIPTEEELCRMFNTSRSNAHYALKRLEGHGILRRNKKQGTSIQKIPSAFGLGKLRSELTRNVCILCHHQPETRDVHVNELLFNALENGLRAENISTTVKDAYGITDLAEYKRLLASLIASGCNALVLIADGTGSGIPFEYPRVLSEFHSKVFVYDPGQSMAPNYPYNIVSPNLFEEGVLAVDYLLPKTNGSLCLCKEAGFRSNWLHERQIGMECALIRSGNTTGLPVVEFAFEGDHAAFFRTLRERGLGDGLGVIAMNDYVAVRLIDAAKAAGLIAGIDFPLISFDNNSLFQNYELTTIAPSLRKIGAKLAEMIVNALSDNDQEEIVTTKINSSLMVRKTA